MKFVRNLRNGDVHCIFLSGSGKLNRHLAVVLVVAATLRIGFLMWSWSGSPLFMPQSTLSQIYFKAGYAIAEGRGYVKKDMQPEMLHPPGMPLMIAAISRSFGIDAGVPMQVLGVALDTAASGILWWIVNAFVGAPIALVAGLLYASFPPFAAYAVMKEPDGLMAFFVVSSLACALKGTKEGWRWNTLAGVLIGLGAYIRPDYLLVPAAMFFGLWAYTRRPWRSLAAVAAMQAVAFALLLPWAYRNYNICGRWIFTSTSVGPTLITGLGEFQNPWGFGPLDEDRAAEANNAGISSPWSCEADNYFRTVFVQSVSERPGAYVMMIIKRLPMALATPHDFGFQNPWKTSTFSEASQNGEDRYQVLIRRPWYVVAAYGDYLVMAGFTFLCLIATAVMAVQERRKWGLIFLLVSPHLYSIGAHLVTHLEPRFLLPSMFCWLIGPGYVLTATRLPERKLIRAFIVPWRRNWT